MAKLPGQIQDLGDEIVRGSILALSWAAREVQQRRKKTQLLVRLMDGQHSLRSDADACLSDCSDDNVIDIPGIVHVAGYVGKATKALVRGEAAQEEFIRERLLRILRGDGYGVVRGLRRMATVQNLSKEKRADVDAACGYFTAHAKRMKCHKYLAAGLLIATRMIEVACRHLVKDRLERSSMRWSASGAQAMFSLSCLKVFHVWDEFQRQLLNPTPFKGVTAASAVTLFLPRYSGWQAAPSAAYSTRSISAGRDAVSARRNRCFCFRNSYCVNGSLGVQSQQGEGCQTADVL
ncbi:MAG: hypothetical protein ACKO2L_18125 [Planctomycetaceae bacterium]